MSRVSSFKPQYRQAPARSVTPPRPVYEPLSPILLPSGPPTTLPHPAGARNRASTPPIHPPKPINGALQSTPVFAEIPLSQPPQGSLALRYEPPRRSSAAVSRPNPQQSLALGSPIEASPTAAMSSSAASLALHLQTDPPRRISHAPVSPTAVSHAPAPTERVPKHAYIPDPTYAYDTRPAKRVRSEFFTSPHYGHQHHHQQQPQPRPATSHLPAWSYNVEQMVDNGVRMYQQDNHPAPSSSEDSRLKRLSDAQLLMDFAFGASHTTHAPPASTAKRWSISHPSQPDLSSQIPYEASTSHLGPRHVSVSYPQEVQRPVDIKYGPELPRESADANSAAPTIQTHTPPEDPAAMPLPPVVHETPNAEESKPKKHQGWPKGKPRGPRNTPVAGKKKRSTPKPKNVPASVAAPPPVDPTGTADQLQSPQSLPTERSGSGQATSIPVESESLNVLESQNRRHSFSNTQPDTQNLGVPSTILRSQSVPPDTGMLIAGSAPEEAPPRNSKKGADALDPICAGCHSSDSMTVIGEGEQWISCDGCKEWYHFGCAGFNNEREVRDVDKFYCEPCRPKHGPTTKVRKSARAHTAVDYAGLNEGILKTSDDNPEHHYIAAFKNGDITFTPETFARMPPELISADYLEKTNGFKEPILIPASLNSRPKPPGLQNSDAQPSEKDSFDEQQEAKLHFEYETVLDDGQDKLDMVIPQGLTVRRVAELYGPNEPVPVIDVKAQEGEDKRWTMSKWADYYEQQGEKPVRNVISLEVSRSRLGRLIRRPKAVRDMDLQDSVWREDDKAPPPPVQFYCLMSVADCYTDFHIDFGGSSVYYHIVKGRKVFFFIPPTKQNLKKYEDWCLAPNQGHEWLGGQVKECYRVDLYPGDTMLIPSGWIHAVWTPSDSLVIGGNFLTRIHYGMQIKVLEIEKNTKVALKFRYPFFQKIMWLTAIAYLEDDPIPDSVEQLLTSGDEFKRNTPIYCEPDAFGNNSHLGPENYNRRYYPKSELEGLTDLLNYIWRTVLISLERIEVTPKVRNAVTRSIPKGHGEPLHLARRFAAWVAWKRGNESIPQWAFPDASLPDTTESGDKKLSAAQIKRMERESANEALRATAERSSARIKDGLQNTTQSSNGSTPMTGFLRPAADPSRHMTTPKTSQLGPKRVACDACRKRRIRCKHKDELVDTPRPGMHTIDLSGSFGISVKRRLSDLTAPSGHGSAADGPVNGGPIMADVNADPYALKSGRVKACADCRKSKRRCIHDEYGNVDPIKAMEVPIPRGSASKKRRVSEGDPVSAKKMKQDPTADGGAMNGEVHAPSSLSNPSSVDGPSSLQDIAYSVQQAMDQDPAEDQVPIDPALQAWGTGSGSGFDMAPSRPPHRDAVVSSIEYHPDGPVPMDGVEHSERSEPQGPSVEPLTPGPPSHTAEPNGIISGQSHDPSPSTTHAHRRTASLELNNHGATLPPPPKTPTANAHRASRIPSASRKSSHTPSRGMDSNRKSKTPKSTPSGSGRRHNSKELIQLEPKDKIMGTEKDADLELALRLQAEEHGLRRRSSR